MTKVSNTINNKFTETGASKVANAHKKVGKAADSSTRSQNRLAQGSVSAGRQFSAQASGLGGLVAAYAGAAATVFALEAAFGALANAAKLYELISWAKRKPSRVTLSR